MRSRLSLRLSDSRGQSLAEFAIAIPIVLMIILGLIECSWALLDQQAVSRITREGSNLISRDATLQDAVTAMKSMQTGPINFDSNAKIIFTVVKRGATVGTANYDKLFVYQRREYGSLAGVSKLSTAGAAAFGPAPDYLAANSDTNANLQVTGAPNSLVAVTGGMVYVCEVYATHELLTPVNRFGLTFPTKLYSIAYF